MRIHAITVQFIFISVGCYCQDSTQLTKIDSVCKSINHSQNLAFRFESDGRRDPYAKQVVRFNNIYFLDTVNHEIRKAYLSEIETKLQETLYFQNNELIKVEYFHIVPALLHNDTIQHAYYFNQHGGLIAVDKEFVSGEIVFEPYNYYFNARAIRSKFYPVSPKE